MVTVKHRLGALPPLLGALVQMTRWCRRWPVALAAICSSRVLGVPSTLVVETRGGSKIACPNTPWARAPMWEIFGADCYRLSWLLDPPCSPLRVLDVGAHIGCFALAVRELRPDGVVHCYEPAPSAAGWLARNAAFGDSSITIHSQGVAGAAGEMLIADDGRASCCNAMVGTYGDTSSERKRVVAVAVVGLADVLRAEGPFHVVKLDCEGSEYDAILSTEAADWAGTYKVVVEYHPVGGHGWGTLVKALGAAGLHLVGHVADVPAPGCGTLWFSREAEAPPGVSQ